jgi:hypothetical protein
MTVETSHIGARVRVVLPRRRVASLAIVALALAGCTLFGETEGADGPASSPPPVDAASDVGEVLSTPADAPDSPGSATVGGDQTPPGTLLEFGEPAVIAIESGRRSGVVEATVFEITAGDAADLEGLGIDDLVAGQVPYYVKLSLENVSNANMPYASLDNDFHGKLEDGTPAGEVGTIEGFRTCESTPAPADFFAGKSFGTCRIFVASSGTRVDSVAYEGFESPYADEPIIWR